MAVVSAVSRRVVVIGAGPAGCAAAIAAREAGAEVQVLDRARFPRPKTCGDALSNEAVRLLRELMPAEVVEALPRAIVHRSVAGFPDGSKIARDFGVDPGWIVPRWDLDAALRGTLERHGIEVREATAVQDITLLDEGISREHAMVLFDEDVPGYVIEDLASTNGTKLNGKRIRSAPLAEGDEIQVGQTLFRFVLAKD